jgi:uridine phosphorylase
MERPYPILEFDAATRAVIEPRNHSRIRAPEHCVVCFFQDVIDPLVADGRAHRIATLRSEIGAHPVYELRAGERRVTLFHPGVGAPLAAGMLEEVIALGCRNFIACGGAGVLDGEIACGHIVVPSSAVRDEGVSYHYLPPAREVNADAAGLAAIEQVLRERHCPYIVGKTWTTDALYRETPTKVALRRAEGCVVVEMEAAAFFAVAHFRGVHFAQLLYGGDDVSTEQWDSRGWKAQSSVRERLLWLAVEACLLLE